MAKSSKSLAFLKGYGASPAKPTFNANGVVLAHRSHAVEVGTLFHIAGIPGSVVRAARLLPDNTTWVRNVDNTNQIIPMPVYAEDLMPMSEMPTDMLGVLLVA